MDDLLAFVHAQLDARMRQLDEDERVARAASADQKSPWHPFEGTYGWAVATESGGIIRDGDYDGNRLVAEHIARWNPERVLAEVATGRAEVEAKRRILERYEGLLNAKSAGETSAAVTRWSVLMTEYETRILPPIIQPYAGRDGWREEWAATR